MRKYASWSNAHSARSPRPASRSPVIRPAWSRRSSPAPRSSRLFQNVREKRGLAYAVFSGLSAYRDAGNITIYAGCANEAVGEVIDLCVEELRGMKRAPVPDAELRR